MEAVQKDIFQCLEAETFSKFSPISQSKYKRFSSETAPVINVSRFASVNAEGLEILKIHLEMQDIHSFGGGGGGGRLFGGGDRRLRQHHSSHLQNHQPLKCPRCDSINTKFCYYNNYNLSQPRHFCKSCRRYWTKDGVLRNVPVGGGCRKTKRSKQKVSSEAVTPTKDNSHSSSESSSLTATTTTAATEAVSAPSSTSASKFAVPNANPSFEAGSLLENQTSDCGIFSEIGNFTNMITSTNEAMGFGFGSISDVASFPVTQYLIHHNQVPPQKLEEELRMHEFSSGLLDQTAHVDLSTSFQSRSTNSGFGALDWPPGGDQGLFDLPNVVDQAFWNQNQWSDRDHPSLFLP